MLSRLNRLNRVGRVGTVAADRAPVAAFTVNDTTPTSEQTGIVFTDESTNTPTSWLWEYRVSGGAWTAFTAHSTEQNPDDRYSLMLDVDVGDPVVDVAAEYVSA